MTADQVIQLTTILLPALMAFLSLCGVMVTAVITVITNRKLNAVQAETQQQTRNIDANTATTDATNRKADTIIEAAAQIHETTNGHLSKVTANLEAANAKIEAMQRLLNNMIDDKFEKRMIAERLAERAGVSSSSIPLAPQRSGDPEADTLVLPLPHDVVITGTIEPLK